MFTVCLGVSVQSLKVIKKLQPKRAFLIGMTHEFEHDLDSKILAEWSARCSSYSFPSIVFEVKLHDVHSIDSNRPPITTLDILLVNTLVSECVIFSSIGTLRACSLT